MVRGGEGRERKGGVKRKGEGEVASCCPFWFELALYLDNGTYQLVSHMKSELFRRSLGPRHST